MSNVTTIHRDPENRAKDASNSIVLKANIFLFENSFSMLQANIFLIESSLSNVTTIHREDPKIRAHDASTTMLRPPLLDTTFILQRRKQYTGIYSTKSLIKFLKDY